MIIVSTNLLSALTVPVDNCVKYGNVLFGDPNDDNIHSASVFKKLLKQYSINQEP